MKEFQEFWRRDVYPRLAPMLALLDTRYAPLLFAAAPQSFSVYRWLWEGSDGSTAAFVFAIIGALGWESVYVGSIAWADKGQGNPWTSMAAFTSLVFSVLVAVHVHRDQGVAALLHAGYPLVAFCYVQQLHNAPLPTWLAWLFQYQQKPATPSTPALPSLLPLLQEPATDSIVARDEVAPVALERGIVAPSPSAQEHSSTKAAVEAYLDEHPSAKIAELLDAFPGKARGTLSGYLSGYKTRQEETVTNTNGRH